MYLWSNIFNFNFCLFSCIQAESLAKKWNDAVRSWKINNEPLENESKEQYDERAFDHGYDGMSLPDINMAATILFTQKAIKIDLRQNPHKISKRAFQLAAQSCGYMPSRAKRM